MKTQTRDSNMELCRIVSMSIICIFHFFCHGIENNAPGNDLIFTIFRNFLELGTNLFFLISGYYLISLNARKLVNFISIIFIFGAINYIALIFTGRHIHVAIFDILFFPISKSPYWFIQVYLLLMLLSPVINRGLETISTKTLRIEVIILTLTVFYCCFLGDNISGNNHLSLLRGLYYYILGNWLRKDDILVRKVSDLSCIFLIIACSIASGAICYITDDISWNDYGSPLPITVSVSMFIMFIRMKLKNSAVNYIAGASLYVYLLEDGFFGFKYLYEWQQIFVNSHDIIQTVMMFSGIFAAYWIIAIIMMEAIKRIMAVENAVIDRIIPCADTKM